ncbi:unnamed protein product [Phytomonas sp. EM1]|nr:unnamed protein product [Phytomonas sp. EM1]|eukprot:CCW63393.1 unnamed protein product [Phytomonas sp. isolate EM1]
MAPKSKKGRGKTVKLTEFNKAYIPEDALDWADDDWMIENREEEIRNEKNAIGKRHEYSRTAKNTLGQEESFRTADMLQPGTKQYDSELRPPYVAHFGNLRNGTTEENFLELFNKDVVVTHRLISQDGKTFAFVEFSSEQALRVALSLDGTVQRARRMYVDLATEKQIERLLNRGVGGAKMGLSRDNAEQAGGLGAMELSRNVFGGQQQPDSPLPFSDRGNFGSRQDLTMMGEFSRDMLGTARPASPLQPNFAFSDSANSPVDFSNWRNEETPAQPDFRGMPERKHSTNRFEQFRSGNNAHADKGGKRNIPTASMPSGNWRDEQPIEVPPTQGDGTEMTKRREDGPAEMNGGRGGGRGRGRGRGAGPEKTTPKDPSLAEKDWASFRK